VIWLGILMLIVNFGISWWNARVVGLDWIESKHLGGWIRFMAWMGWLMSALGFTWCYILILSLIARGTGYIDDQAMQAAIALGYLIVVPGILISGSFIWIDSLVQAWRRRDLPSIGTAAWNTFAEVSNVASAVQGVGSSAKSVGSLFTEPDPDDVKGAAVLIVVLIVIAALAGGVLTTEMIRRHYAGSRALPPRPVPAAA
jgi:hypothetical protein